MADPKIIKKGEFLFKEGEAVSNLYLIQSGKISVVIPRPKANVEVMVVGNNGVIGDYAFAGINRHPMSGFAVMETKVLELPLDPIMKAMEQWPQLHRILIKGMADKIKSLLNEVKANKLEKNNVPCPAEQVPKIFAVFYHVAMLKGTKKPESEAVTVEWRNLKQYAQKVFMESPNRLEQVLNIFVKLKMAEFKMVKSEEDPEAPEEIGPVTIYDPKRIELFFEFYQFYYYKGASGADLLKVNETMVSIVGGLLKLAEGEKADKNGTVRIDFNKAQACFQNDFGVKLSPENIGVLEQKGLFMKRSVAEGGGAATLSFDQREFYQMHINWKVLKEIEGWNQKGFVDPKEEEKKPINAAAKGGPACPSCHNPMVEGHKFCGHCGHKIAA